MFACMKKLQRIHFISEWLEQLGLQQADVVDALGVNKGTVSKWCSGKLPSEDSLLALADFLKIDPNRLFHDPDGKQKAHTQGPTIDKLLEVVEGSYHMLGVDQEAASELLELVVEVASEPPTPSAGEDYYRVQSEREVRRFLKLKRIRDDGA